MRQLKLVKLPKVEWKPVRFYDSYSLYIDDTIIMAISLELIEDIQQGNKRVEVYLMHELVGGYQLDL